MFCRKYNKEVSKVGQLFSYLAYVALYMNSRSKTGVIVCSYKWYTCIHIMGLYEVTLVI